ncbi:MAG: hypothetical protein R6U11_08720 [Bacteroidales bacterium]
MGNTSAGKRGHNAEKPGQIPMKGWKDIALRVKNQLIKDHVPIISAGTAFFFSLQFFPLLQLVYPYMGWLWSRHR